MTYIDKLLRNQVLLTELPCLPLRVFCVEKLLPHKRKKRGVYCSQQEMYCLVLLPPTEIFDGGIWFKMECFPSLLYQAGVAWIFHHGKRTLSENVKHIICLSYFLWKFLESWNEYLIFNFTKVVFCQRVDSYCSDCTAMAGQWMVYWS